MYLWTRCFRFELGNKTCEKGIEQDVRSSGININLVVLSVKIGHGVVDKDLGFEICF